MKKLIIITLALILNLQGCSRHEVNLQGFYQSERINGYIIQVSFDKDIGEFVQFIDNRQVNSGTFESTGENTYSLTGNKVDYSIILKKNDSFDIIINQINDHELINLSNSGKIPTSFLTQFDDIKKYKSLLD